ncbi:MAG: isoprenylcysteine carboxyl methyltransferase [candidate division Zixibacteria bacterium]|nr:isoprenylcysteine carboxyl methyltransferase [candidate division Zixibacteria bacterium]
MRLPTGGEETQQMESVFWLVYLTAIFQRLSELWLARRHTRMVQAEGGYEAGKDHYRWVVCLHVGFFIALPVEVHLRSSGPSPQFFFWLGLYLIAQIVRYWAIVSLGKYWNTRIFVVSGMRRVKTGPYRFVAHPNYVAVVVELLALPLMFDAYLTTVAASSANALVLRRRIRVEEEALRAETER